MRYRPGVRLVLFLTLTFCLFALTGCTRRLSGTYTDEQNIVTLEFRDGKAYMGTFLGNKSQLDYEVKGKDLILKAPQGNMVMHIEDDGSLSGFGTGSTLRKK